MPSSLGTLALGTYANVSSTAAQGSDPLLEVIASPDDTDYAYDATNSTHVGTASFAIADMPSDFASIATVTVRLRYHWTTGTQVNSWNSLSAQIVQSDGTTALTDSVAVASAITTTTPTNSGTITLTNPNTSADRTTWNGALLLVKWDIAKNKSGDTIQKRVTAGEISGTYNVIVAAAWGARRFTESTING